MRQSLFICSSHELEVKSEQEDLGKFESITAFVASGRVHSRRDHVTQRSYNKIIFIINKRPKTVSETSESEEGKNIFRSGLELRTVLLLQRS